MKDDRTPVARVGRAERRTRETRIAVRVDLDRFEPPRVSTGIGFFDHMLEALATHGRLGLRVDATGDLDVDDHHTVEDCALVIGSAIGDALGERPAIRRFGSAYAPLDEALARAVIDVSGRPSAVVVLGLTRERLGSLSCENVGHFFRSLAASAGLTIHVDVLRGENDHHRAEAAFKAFALALRSALALERDEIVPSTKGVIDFTTRAGPRPSDAGVTA